MRLINRAVPGVLAGALLLSGASGVFAAKPHAAKVRIGYAWGQVTAYTPDSSLTLTRTPKNAAKATKTFQITLTGTTKDVARKGTTGPLAVNDYALVVGTKSASGLTALRVLYSVKRFAAGRMVILMKARRILLARHRAAGTVSNSVAPNGTTPGSLTITTKAGKSLTFEVTSATKFRIGKQVQTTEPTFTQNQRVIVRFRKDLKTGGELALEVVVPATKSA